LNDPEAVGVFQSVARFFVGDGPLTYFWRDQWISGYTAEELAPEVFAMVPTRRKNTCRVAEALREDGWIDDIQGEMTVELWMQCMRLWEAVETVERDVSSPDRISWKRRGIGNLQGKGHI
jgi:transposase-like protein